MSIQIEPAWTEQELAAIEALSERIWHEHYTPIIGKDQVVYMLEKFHTVRAMREQIENDGYKYVSLLKARVPVGYAAFQLRDDNCFLSKLYIEAAERGNGFARTMLEHIEQTALHNGLAAVQLTVNKRNSDSIAAYLRLGFEQVGEAVFDIGAGYVMDDLILEKRLV